MTELERQTLKAYLRRLYWTRRHTRQTRFQRIPTAILAIINAPLPATFTLQDISRATGLHRTSALRALAWLEQRGIITAKRHGKGRGHHNVYSFTPYEHWSISQKHDQKREINPSPQPRRKTRTCPRINHLPEEAKRNPKLRKHFDYPVRPRFPYWRDLAILFRHTYLHRIRPRLEGPEADRTARMASTLWTSISMHHVVRFSFTVGEALALWYAVRASLERMPATPRQLLHRLYILTCALRRQQARVNTFEHVYMRYHTSHEFAFQPLLVQRRRVRGEHTTTAPSSHYVDYAQGWVYSWRTAEPLPPPPAPAPRPRLSDRIRQAWEERLRAAEDRLYWLQRQGRL